MLQKFVLNKYILAMKKVNNCKKPYVLTAIALLFVATFVTACSSGDSEDETPQANEGFLKCKIDGTPRVFNYQVGANDKPDDFNAIHFVTVGGLETNDPRTSPGFDFQLISDEGAKETTYTAANESGPDLTGQYYVQTGTGTTSYMGNGNSGTSFTLTITSITNWGVKGTFSGVLKSNDVFVTVTDGEFAAPYNKN